MKRLLATALIAPTLMAGVSASASEDSDTWARSTPVDQSYSIETPCPSGEGVTAPPMKIGGTFADTGTTVVCVEGKMLFSSGVLSAPVDELGGEKLFDLIEAGLAEMSVPGTVDLTRTTISGKRVLISREASNDSIAQTGVIELSDSALLMLVAGGNGEGVAALIDRHANSLKVVSQ